MNALNKRYRRQLQVRSLAFWGSIAALLAGTFRLGAEQLALFITGFEALLAAGLDLFVAAHLAVPLAALVSPALLFLVGTVFVTVTIATQRSAGQLRLQRDLAEGAVLLSPEGTPVQWLQLNAAEEEAMVLVRRVSREWLQHLWMLGIFVAPALLFVDELPAPLPVSVPALAALVAVVLARLLWSSAHSAAIDVTIDAPHADGFSVNRDAGSAPGIDRHPLGLVVFERQGAVRARPPCARGAWGGRAPFPVVTVSGGSVGVSAPRVAAVRQASIEALDRLVLTLKRQYASSAEERCLSMLRDRQEQEKQRYFALRYLDDKQGLDVTMIDELVTDDSLRIRLRAALVGRRDDLLAELLVAHPADQPHLMIAAVRALLERGRWNTELGRVVLAAGSDELREGVLKMPEVVFSVEDLVAHADSEAHPSSRAEAVVRIGRLGTPDNLDALARLGTSPVLREAANTARQEIHTRFNLARQGDLALTETGDPAGGLSEPHAAGGLTSKPPAD